MELNNENKNFIQLFIFNSVYGIKATLGSVILSMLYIFLLLPCFSKHELDEKTNFNNTAGKFV